MPFKSEWKDSYPMRKVYNDKCIFFCLTCGRTFRCSHRCGHSGQNDIKKHFSYDNHKAIVDSWKRQTEKNCIFSCRQAGTVSKETD